MKRPGKGAVLAAAAILLGHALFFAGAQEEPAAEGGTLGARLALDGAETSPERHRREIAEEASSQLFNMNVWDTEVSLFIKGYWKGALSLNWGIASGPLGTAPESDDSPLLFTQEADLTLSLWIWEKWFLEVSFLDDYDLNTYRAGYQGLPGEPVQYAGIGNTGLDFPAFPYLDLGGDSPSSFGFYGRFGSGELAFHTLLRYDAAAREERTFVGNRERNFSTLTPDKTLRGRSFVLPQENIPSVPVVYLEDKNGSLSGGSRRWRLAGPSEYAVSARHGLVELVREHSGMVAVSYAGGYPLGTYTTAASGFLWEVQEYFDSTRTLIKLEEYPQPGQSTPGTPGTITINGTPALVIYEPGTFSPFERQSRYMAPSSNTEEAALIRLSNGERIEGYEVFSAASLSLSLDISLYTVTGDDSGRNIFEISRTGAGSRDRRAPDSRWPLEEYPELYLPGAQKFTEDIRIRFTNYGAAGAYVIGTDIIPGSVQVYRGGIMDSQVSYDPGSGAVTLASPVGFNEVIRISYLKRSDERRLGSLAAGVGLVYTPEDSPFSAEGALGLRWNVSREAYTEEGASSPGTVGFGGRTSWNYENLKASLSLGLGFEQPDTTGLYRVAGMEGNSEIVLGVSTGAGFISEKPARVDPALPSLPLSWPAFPLSLSAGNRVDLIYRNYRTTNFLGASELKNIDWSAPVVSGLKGPYPSRDADWDVFVAEFENLGGGQWTGFQVPLGQDGTLLEQAKTIVVPLRFYNFDVSNPEILVLAQFGVLAEEGSGGVENSSLIVEAPIFYGTAAGTFGYAASLPSSWIERNDSDGYAVAITLTDQMRRSLQNATQMRLLIINTGSSPFSGRVLAAKPFIMGASWRAITLDGGKIRAAQDVEKISATERRDPALRSGKIDRLHESGSNHVLEVRWDSTAPAAGADGRTPAIPLSNYRVLSFYLRGSPSPFPANSRFHFIISQGPGSYGDPNKTALELTASLDNLFDQDRWYNVEIHYGRGRRRFLVDGHEYPADIHYRPEALRQNILGEADFTGDGQSGYAAVFVETTAPSGSFSIDEICLEDPSPSFRVNGGGALDWRHPGGLVQVRDRELLSDLAFTTALESAVQGDPFNSQAETFSGVQSRSQGETSILGLRTTGNLQFMASNDTSYWSAGHGLSRSFGLFSFSESFNTSPYDEAMDHALSLNLGTPVFGNLSSSMVYQNHRLTRIWNGSTGIKDLQNLYPGFSLEGSLQYTEKTEKPGDWMPNYAKTWAQSWTMMFPDSGAGMAESVMQDRRARARGGIFFNYLPVGADLSFEGNSEVSVPLEISKSSSTVRLDFPFAFDPFHGNLRFQRNILRSLMYSGRDIGDDLFQYGKSLSDASPLWREIPIYALFDSKLDSAMDRTLSSYTLEAENTRFNENLLLNLFFPERYDISSLVTPVHFFTQLDRTVEQRLDTRLDVFTFNSSLGFSSINLFGALGNSPVFRFYRNDEFRHSITGIVSFPESEEPQWRIQAEQFLGFYGFRGAELAVNNILSAATSGWIENFTLLWTIPREKTLLSAIYGAVIRKAAGNGFFPFLDELALSEYERLIRESLEFVIDHSGEKGVYQVILGHESLVRIMGRLTLTGFAKFDFTRNKNTSLTSIMLRFGATLSVSF
ncbi:MAG: hypothetical protein LBE02_09325 [Spirochaetaceae bacterium]|jgi:hypothetical protein|nr:hypothetical protein [Spirochaetaceae bacterium]